MHILVSIVSSFLFLMSQTFTATSQHLPKETLYPWKSKTGIIGYSNQDGVLKINPQFEDASLFTNQYAIVQKNGKKGVIDKKGIVKIECEYEEIQLADVGEETIAITRKKYNAWWKITQWRMFPGFSIMGGNSDKRIFDTHVARTKWEIISLNHKQKLLGSDHKNDKYPYEASNIQYFADKVLINDHLYSIFKGHFKKISGTFKGILTDSTLLRRDGNSYKKIGMDLKPQGNEVFKIPKQISVKINGHQKELQTASTISGIVIKYNFMEDQDGHIFLYPDLVKTFPVQINKYFDDNTDAETIIGNAHMICSVPETDCFLIYSIINNKKGFYILNQDGTWESDKSKTKDFMIRSNSGNVIYPTVSDLGIDDFLPKDFEVKRIERTVANKHWLAVKGINKSDSHILAGIFDIENKRWVLPMEYSSLEEIKGYPYIWKFEFTNISDYKKKKYGLIDINTRKITATPVYNSMNRDAMAGYFSEGKWDLFYINPITAKEYREAGLVL